MPARVAAPGRAKVRVARTPRSPAEMLVKLADALGATVDHLLTGNPVEDSPLASSRLFRRFKVLEALTLDDQETVIKVIDALIAKERMTVALMSVDAAA